MRQFKLNLIQNDEYHKVIDTWAANSFDLKVSEHIVTIIKDEVAKNWYQRRNTIVFTKHMEKNRFHMFRRTWKQPAGYLELFHVHICPVQKRLPWVAAWRGADERLVASFTSLSNMSCTLVSCDILNICGRNFTNIRLYEAFQYNTDSAERFRTTILISNSQ